MRNKLDVIIGRANFTKWSTLSLTYQTFSWTPIKIFKMVKLFFTFLKKTNYPNGSLVIMIEVVKNSKKDWQIDFVVAYSIAFNGPLSSELHIMDHLIALNGPLY